MGPAGNVGAGTAGETAFPKEAQKPVPAQIPYGGRRKLIWIARNARHGAELTVT